MLRNATELDTSTTKGWIHLPSGRTVAIRMEFTAIQYEDFSGNDAQSKIHRIPKTPFCGLASSGPIAVLPS